MNCYAEASTGVKDQAELVGAPGIVAFSALNGGAGRGLFVMRGTLYAVAGNTFYKIDDQGSETGLGALPGSGKLQFAGNGVEIVFSNRYIFANSTVSLIADPDLPTVSAMDFIDGYVVFAESGTQRWGSSDLYDGATYDALDSTFAEAYPDDIVTLKVNHRQVLVFGQETTQIFYNAAAAGAGFPFEALSGAYLEIGCAARLSVANQDNSVFWLANDRTFRRLTEQTPVRVSQHNVERALARYTRVDDCEAFPWVWDGHLFVTWRFPSAGATWVYDCTTSEFHERATYGSNAWDVIDAANCYGKIFVQSAATGAVGYLSDSTYTEFGGTLRREWTYPQVYETNRLVRHNLLELIARTGDAPIGEVAHVNLEISNDGGNTWFALPPRELGRTGEYGHVVRWPRLGAARDRVYRMSVDDAHVPVHVLATTLQAN